MATRIGIMAEIGMDGRGFRAGLLAAENAAARFGRRLAGLFTVSAISIYVKRTIDWASSMSDLAKSIGVTTEQMQELDYAAKQTGLTAESFIAAFRSMSKWRSEALKDVGGKAMSIAKALGISREDLLGATKPFELFQRVVDSIRKRDFGAAEADVVTSILGRGSLEMLAMIKDGFEELRQKARAAGVVMNDEVVGSLDRMGDKMAELSAMMRTQFGPVIVWVVDHINDMAEKAVHAISIVADVFKKVNLKSIWQGTIIAGGMAGGEEPRHMGIWDKVVRSGLVLKGMAGYLSGVGGEIQQALDAAIVAHVGKSILGAGPKTLEQITREMVSADWLKKAEKAKDFKVPTDELARIGGFIGGTGTAVSIAREQLSETKILRREVVKISGFATSQF